MNIEWIRFRKRYIPAILPVINYWSWPVGKVLGVERSITVHAWDEGWCKAFWNKKSSGLISQKVFEILSQNLDSFDQIRQGGIEVGESIVKHCKDFASTSKEATLEEYLVFLKEFKKLNNKFVEKSMTYWLFPGKVVEEKIKNLLSEFNDKEKQEILNIMSIPGTKSYSQVEEEDFHDILKICKERGIDSDLAKNAIKKFSDKYYWFPYEYIGPDIWDIPTVTKRVKEALEGSNSHEMLSKISEKQQECVKRYNLSQGLIDLFKIIHLTILMQDDRKKYNTQSCYYLNRTILGDLAEKLGISLEHARYIEHTLLKKFISDKDQEYLKNELISRTKLVAAIERDEGTEILSGDKAISRMNELGIKLEDDTEGITEFKGRTACKGFAKGRVRVLLTSSGVEDFNEGDILVTPMTTPDFVPIMGKAGAIVTDEGGITCHAAIVSREMGIPCIVGTEIATKVLKDDDIVEVNADEGVVKVIKEKGLKNQTS